MPANTSSSQFPPFPQFDGIFVLDKPSGPTSSRCLNLFKKLGQKKIGHAGTLDPMAAGVLIVLLGQATKLSSHLMASGKKTYRGRLRLGVETDTWDMEGDIIAEKTGFCINPHEAAAAIGAWKRLESQEVPAYSAAKHNGQPLYKLARKGAETPIKIKNIKIYEAGMIACDMPFVDFRVTCSSGAYIRSLAHSLGKRLGCGAALCSLTREYSHPFGLEAACGLSTLAENPHLLQNRLRPIDEALPEWCRIRLNERQIEDVRNGRPLLASQCALSPGKVGDLALLCAGSTPIALARLSDGPDAPRWIIIRGLWT